MKNIWQKLREDIGRIYTTDKFVLSGTNGKIKMSISNREAGGSSIRGRHF